jgi:hypothetical protein
LEASEELRYFLGADALILQLKSQALHSNWILDDSFAMFKKPWHSSSIW